VTAGVPSAVLALLKQHWGYDSLKPPQAEIVQCLLEGRDVMAVLPTGFGKSLCFQLPAILQTGTTLVVSPLIALMEDQVQQLQRKQLPAAALHSQMAPYQRRRVLQQLEDRQLRLLYLSPESLFSPPVWQRLQNPRQPLNGLMLDEAHTLVHWGESFRPDYRRLGVLRPALGQTFPIAAFTATAAADSQRVLHQVLQLQDPLVVKANPQRSHIHLRIEIAWTPLCRRQRLFSFIRQQDNASGLVYVRSRDACEDLAARLAQQGLATAAYHGGLAPQQRRQLEREWLASQRPFLVCTNAFGMGIDLPTVRWIVHYQPPPTPIDYVQEVGRAGRDGLTARALMLVSEPTGWLDGSDRQLHQYFETRSQQLHQQAELLLKHLPTEGSYESAIRKYGRGTKLSLALLHQAGCLDWLDPFHFRLTHRPHRLPIATQLAATGGAGMETIVLTRHCRWQAIAIALGYPNSPPCGTCDNCMGSNPRVARK
jgi:ATP-dependent DNA helicase RecQ